MTYRKIIPYVRRDAISWWAGAKYADAHWSEAPYIRETSCSTRWGSVNKARRIAKKMRRLQRRNLLTYSENVGGTQ